MPTDRIATARPSIIDVEDTRRHDEHGYIIPDSGDNRPCDLCGRAHAVHYVLDDGRRVGSGCARTILGIPRTAPLLIEARYEVWAGVDLIGNEPPRRVCCYAGLPQLLVAWPPYTRRHKASWRAATFPREYAFAFDRLTGLTAALWSCGRSFDDLDWTDARDFVTAREHYLHLRP